MVSSFGVALSISRMTIGLLFLVAGITKSRRGSSQFQQAILGYDLVDAHLARKLARWIPRLEITVGILLMIGLFTKPAVGIASMLTTIFTAAVTISLYQGRKNHCGCIGFTWDRVQKVQWILVYRNLGILVLLFADFASTLQFGIDRWFSITSFPPSKSFWLCTLAVSLFLTIFGVLTARILTFIRPLVRHSNRRASF